MPRYKTSEVTILINSFFFDHPSCASVLSGVIHVDRFNRYTPIPRAYGSSKIVSDIRLKLPIYPSEPLLLMPISSRIYCNYLFDYHCHLHFCKKCADPAWAFSNRVDLAESALQSISVLYGRRRLARLPHSDQQTSSRFLVIRRLWPLPSRSVRPQAAYSGVSLAESAILFLLSCVVCLHVLSG
jgi:hypothetical protein